MPRQPVARQAAIDDVYAAYDIDKSTFCDWRRHASAARDMTYRVIERAPFDFGETSRGVRRVLRQSLVDGYAEEAGS